VPEICRFYGIVVKMFFSDHAPPHFHAEYAGQQAVIDIRTNAIIGGALPSRALGLTVEWASLHRGELMELWKRAEALQPLERIDPLP